MQVGQENIAYPMECERCNYNWLAVVEASKIEWSEFHVELHHGGSLECPECGYWTDIDKGEPPII
jgi:DNA-directed RNA polymerase subunit RPC12/RpoP